LNEHDTKEELELPMIDVKDGTAGEDDGKKLTTIQRI
jgi:hypothetical protein